jgi:Fic family protein
MIPEIMNAISVIHEYRGKQDLYLVAEPSTMDKLCEIARIQSTKASNKIENISTSDKRLRELMAEKVEPKTRDEREIAGYRYVLDMIHESYRHIDITPHIILQLHRDLYRYLNVAFAGHWKDCDNVIAEISPTGEAVARFVPTSAVATPYAIESLCQTYNKEIREGRYDPLLLISLFVFDFVSIHPFNDGNGRISRLLTLLLLYKSNYLVGKYISIEQGIEESKETYYEALQASSVQWSEGKNDYVAFITYLLGVVSSCYKTLGERMEIMSNIQSNETKIRSFFDVLVGSATKREIMDANPHMSQKTIERILQKLQAEGTIEKIGAARATKYTKTENMNIK